MTIDFGSDLSVSSLNWVICVMAVAFEWHFVVGIVSCCFDDLFIFKNNVLAHRSIDMGFTRCKCAKT